MQLISLGLSIERCDAGNKGWSHELCCAGLARNTESLILIIIRGVRPGIIFTLESHDVNSARGGVVNLLQSHRQFNDCRHLKLALVILGDHGEINSRLDCDTFNVHCTTIRGIRRGVHASHPLENVEIGSHSGIYNLTRLNMKGNHVEISGDKELRIVVLRQDLNIVVIERNQIANIGKMANLIGRDEDTLVLTQFARSSIKVSARSWTYMFLLIGSGIFSFLPLIRTSLILQTCIPYISDKKAEVAAATRVFERVRAIFYGGRLNGSMLPNKMARRCWEVVLFGQMEDGRQVMMSQHAWQNVNSSRWIR